VCVGVPAADERQPVSDRLLAERFFSGGLRLESAGSVLADQTPLAERLPQFNEVTAPSDYATEHIPVLSCMLGEGTARDRWNPFIGPSTNGFPGIGKNGLGRLRLVSEPELAVALTEHLTEASPVIVLTFSSSEDQTSEVYVLIQSRMLSSVTDGMYPCNAV